MRELTIKLYQFDELTDDAKERARRWYRDATAADSFYLDEIYESIKGVFEEAGIKLKDWTLGPCTYNSVTFDLGDSEGLTGARAFAWLENNLLGKLRISPEQFAKNRKNYLSYGDSYRVGKVKPCPITGVCYDEDFLDALQQSIKAGDTLKEAFKNLADVCQRLCDNEVEYRNADEQVDEDIRANEYEFTEEGRRA